MLEFATTTQGDERSVGLSVHNIVGFIRLLDSTVFEINEQGYRYAWTLDLNIQRIRGFLNAMRNINPRFTYLLTYLLTILSVLLSIAGDFV